MSASELERLHWMRALVERRATQREVARHLGVGIRQVQRLRDAFVESGPKGLVSSRRGKPSNRRLAQSYRDQVLDIVRTRYPGFGPTLAHELREEDHLRKTLGEPGQQDRRPKTARAPTHDDLAATADPLLGHALAWARNYAASQPAPRSRRRAAESPVD